MSDKYEVHVVHLQFVRETIENTGSDLRSMSKDGTVENGRENHPIEGITFEEARDYCILKEKDFRQSRV